jgi:CheY-like chemotaxis protein
MRARQMISRRPILWARHQERIEWLPSTRPDLNQKGECPQCPRRQLSYRLKPTPVVPKPEGRLFPLRITTGQQVTEAENGQVAVEAITAARPDVIILDLMMPKMDAFEFLDELRSRPNWRDIPVVVITAKELTDEDRNRLNGGVERIIQKSDRDEMLRQLSREIGECVKRQTLRIT